MNIFEELGEDEIFHILSHPIRRRILSFIFYNKNITFTILSKDWGLKTGPIYHHLSKLQSIVTQNELNQYLLNENGITLCEWYLKSDNGRSTVTKIDSFTSLAFPLTRSLNENKSKMMGLIFVIYLLGIYYSHKVQIAIIGPFLIPRPDSIDSSQILLFNTGIILSFLILYLITIYIFIIREKNELLELSLGYLLSIVPNMVIIISMSTIASFISLTIPIFWWFVLSQISQLFYLFLNESYLVTNHGITIEKGIIVLLAHLYVILGFIILII